MWIVKLGGSLFDSEQLRSWLKLLSDAGSLVVVPGGGPFADQVRQAQHAWEFDDATAHIMALLAMEQFGSMLCGLQPGLAAAASLAQIDEVLQRGETPVWMPSAMVLAEPGIEHGWGVTSDSLAAWLGGQLGADKLLLVKSIALYGKSRPAKELAVRGVIDARFGEYLQQSGMHAWVMAKADHGRFEEVRQGNMVAAVRIITQESSA